MKNYLFLFTISPVQSFIAQARKTQDLYSGSKLISDLIKAAFENFSKEDQIIFPVKNGENLPNRFVAAVKRNNDEEVKKLGEKIENSVRNYLKSISLKAFEENAITSEDLEKNFLMQIESFLEIYWTAYEYDQNNYDESYTAAEKQLASIKNYRGFSQLVEKGKKCSICGQRNILIDVSKLRNDKKYLVNKDEGLCAICFTKRFYIKEHYPSTAELSLYDTISKLESKLSNNDNQNLIEYKRLFGDYFDAQLFYKENLTEQYFRKQNLDRFIQKINEINHEYSKRILIPAKNNNLKITPYYAMVMFDADNMGNWIAGKNLNLNGKLMDYQNKLSNSLHEFASSIDIKKPEGISVYSGGDDFMGFFNLNYLFARIKELYENFISIVNTPLKEYLSNKKITISGGIVIAHYKTPLNIVIEECRNLEKEAKKINEDKNAFAISVMKHSGEINKAIFHWINNDGKVVIDYFEKLSKILSQNKISNSFIKNFQLEFSKLIYPNEIKNGKMVLSELERLIRNSKAAKSNDSIVEDVIYNAQGIYNSSNSISNFISALQIIDFISKHLNGGNHEN